MNPDKVGKEFDGVPAPALVDLASKNEKAARPRALELWVGSEFASATSLLTSGVVSRGAQHSSAANCKCGRDARKLTQMRLRDVENCAKTRSVQQSRQTGGAFSSLNTKAGAVEDKRARRLKRVSPWQHRPREQGRSARGHTAHATVALAAASQTGSALATPHGSGVWVSGMHCGRRLGGAELSEPPGQDASFH